MHRAHEPPHIARRLITRLLITTPKNECGNKEHEQTLNEFGRAYVSQLDDECDGLRVDLNIPLQHLTRALPGATRTTAMAGYSQTPESGIWSDWIAIAYPMRLRRLGTSFSNTTTFCELRFLLGNVDFRCFRALRGQIHRNGQHRATVNMC